MELIHDLHRLRDRTLICLFYASRPGHHCGLEGIFLPPVDRGDLSRPIDRSRDQGKSEDYYNREVSTHIRMDGGREERIV